MSKSEEILRPSDFINDPENCLFDEFKHNLPLNTEEVTDPKQLLVAGCAICAHSAIPAGE